MSEHRFVGKQTNRDAKGHAATCDVYDDGSGGLVFCKEGEKPADVLAGVKPFEEQMRAQAAAKEAAMTPEQKVDRLLRRHGLTVDDLAAAVKASPKP